MKRFCSSFKCAFCGIISTFRSETNFKIHTFIALSVIITGFIFRITVYEWIAASLCIGLVMALECVNSAVERLCDLYTKEHDERIKAIKDMSAGAVLISAIASAAVGVIIFLKYIFPKN